MVLDFARRRGYHCACYGDEISVGSGVRRVFRRALTDRLASALDGGSVLIVASAGFGKTIALEQAIAARGMRSACVLATPAERQPVRLLRVLGAALDEALPGAAQLLSERLAAGGEGVDPGCADARFSALTRPFELTFGCGTRRRP